MEQSLQVPAPVRMLDAVRAGRQADEDAGGDRAELAGIHAECGDFVGEVVGEQVCVLAESASLAGGLGRRFPEPEVCEHRRVVVEGVADARIIDVEQSNDLAAVDDQLRFVEVAVHGCAAEFRACRSGYERVGEIIDAPCEVRRHDGEHRRVAERIRGSRRPTGTVELHRPQTFQQIAVGRRGRPRRPFELDVLSERLAGELGHRHPALVSVCSEYRGNGQARGEESFVALDERPDLVGWKDLDIDHDASSVADTDDPRSIGR